uniref:Uncharacterized protein n=1 Tax=Moniliophthora roreri TaxID=221103 RepID=A0A0W0FQB5_MONRR
MKSRTSSQGTLMSKG